jgi:hypothetical protein
MTLTHIDSAATTTRLLPRSDLTRADLAAMQRLLDRHFEGVTPEQFRRDLDEKNWAILIERAGCLVGFTTLLAYETQFRDEPVSVIYSGDTIVAPEAWNSSALPRAWIEAVAGLRRLYPRGQYVWLLITSGFRTYRLLPVFWRDFYPRCDSPTPSEWLDLMSHLAAERFGPAYDSRAGIVRLHAPQRLRGALVEVPTGRRDDWHVEFFLSRNPGHPSGDELVCVTELAPENLTPAGRRMASACPRW